MVNEELEQLQAKNKAMALLLEEAMAIFSTYLNVPESLALREAWEKLKNS